MSFKWYFFLIWTLADEEQAEAAEREGSTAGERAGVSAAAARF